VYQTSWGRYQKSWGRYQKTKPNNEINIVFSCLLDLSCGGLREVLSPALMPSKCFLHWFYEALTKHNVFTQTGNQDGFGAQLSHLGHLLGLSWSGPWPLSGALRGQGRVGQALGVDMRAPRCPLGGEGGSTKATKDPYPRSSTPMGSLPLRPANNVSRKVHASSMFQLCCTVYLLMQCFG